MKQTVAKYFSEEGQLQEAIPGFSPRAAQTDMAAAVSSVILDSGSLVVEAGTGTGKTFAYLVPALTSNKKVILSTGTKNLQEQLFLRDLPIIKQALSSHKSTALLKGRANYLCSYRLSQFTRQSHLVDANVLTDVTKIREWSVATQSGDLGELDNIAEDSAAIPYVTSTVDNCLGRDCPDYEECFMVKARKQALDAELVVVNHHLFFADLALKDTGFGELIPEADVIIFDEAHQVPDIAVEYFGETLSSRQVSDLCRDIEILQKTALKDAAQLTKAAEKLRQTWWDLRILFPDTPQKGNWIEQLRRAEVAQQISRIKSAFDVFYEVMKVHLGRDKELDNLFDRFCQSRSKLSHLMNVQQTGVSFWYETTPKHTVLHATPLSIADKFSEIMEERSRSWVFTSATLSVDQSFSHYRQALGLDKANELYLDSPFDYQKQGLLCVPRYLEDNFSPGRKDQLLEFSVELIKASKGRCFLLFTSHAMLRKIAEALPDYIDNPLLIQGQSSKRVLLQQFLEDSQAVLLGTGAFWEGVDVKGADLICVLIDKLPFASPDDPLLKAKMEDARKQGKNPFATVQLPQAIISLKQGAGRLIRDAQDKGVLVICDDRLVNRDYGETFLRSLPDMMRTRSIKRAVNFLQEINDESDENTGN